VKIAPRYAHVNAPPCGDRDYISIRHLDGSVPPKLLDRLRRHAYLTGLDGQPCFESWHLQELMDMLACAPQPGDPP
jgi:hypothetical protein